MGMGESVKAKALDPLLPEILSVTEWAGESGTSFGYRVAGDPALVSKMKRGRRIKKQALRVKIKAELAVMKAKVEGISALD